jgi:hypothetical protein
VSKYRIRKHKKKKEYKSRYEVEGGDSEEIIEDDEIEGGRILYVDEQHSSAQPGTCFSCFVFRSRVKRPHMKKRNTIRPFVDEPRRLTIVAKNRGAGNNDLSPGEHCVDEREEGRGGDEGGDEENGDVKQEEENETVQRREMTEQEKAERDARKAKQAKRTRKQVEKKVVVKEVGLLSRSHSSSH